MVEAAKAKGAAHGASVVTVDNTPEALEEALAKSRKAAARRAVREGVERLRAKVAKQEDQLVGTEAALAAAEQELAAAEQAWAEEDGDGLE